VSDLPKLHSGSTEGVVSDLGDVSISRPRGRCSIFNLPRASVASPSGGRRPDAGTRSVTTRGIGVAPITNGQLVRDGRG